MTGSARNLTRRTRPRRGRRDPLTGLGHRGELAHRAPRLLATAGAAGAAVAVLVVDLDAFKHVNDSVGHLTGDRVLLETADRLRATLGPEDLLVRLGGDEFAILSAPLGNDVEQEVARLAGGVLGAFDAPYEVEELTLSVLASVGVACFPEDGTDVETLLRAADQAMYAAKEAGSGRWRSADSRVAGPLGRTRRLLRDLRSPDLAEQIVVHYQPQVRPSDGRVLGFEALARWQHPELGILAARDFIPLAERSDLMGPVTEAVLAQSLAALPLLQGCAPSSRLSLHVTSRHLLNHRLVEDLARRVRASGISAEHLVVEVSGTHVSGAPHPVFTRLLTEGIGISLRGYGRAWSAPTTLWRNRAVGEVKLAQQVVRAVSMGHDEASRLDAARLLEALIGSAQALDVRVVAEGVEDSTALAVVSDLGCDLVQGYLVREPAALDEVLRWSADRSLSAPG